MTFRSFWKGETREEQKRRQKRADVVARAACRALVIVREKGRCQRCGIGVSDAFPDWHPQRAHVHEKVLRSLGGDATDPENCELLCQACHMPGGQHAPTKERM